MSDKPPVKNSMQRVRQAAYTLVLVAVAARIVWGFLAPLLPILICFIVVLAVIWFALFGVRSK